MLGLTTLKIISDAGMLFVIPNAVVIAVISGGYLARPFFLCEPKLDHRNELLSEHGAPPPSREIASMQSLRGARRHIILIKKARCISYLDTLKSTSDTGD
jgi:hypothetical protein